MLLSRRSLFNAALAASADLSGALRRIKPPAFPNRQFDITRYGAKPGGDVWGRAVRCGGPGAAGYASAMP